MNETDWLDRVDPDVLTDILGGLMSAVSEDCYSAGWIQGTEYLVPALCKRVLESNAPQPWGHGELGLGIAAILQTIANKLGHWADFNERGKGYVSFDPFPTPAEHLTDLDHWKDKKK